MLERGMKPSDLLLLSLIGCASYNVVTILEKQRQKLVSLRIFADAEQDDDPPYRFRKIQWRYQFTGNELNEGFVQRAIELSEQTYCAAHATLRDAVEISSIYEIESV
jgi:putative redox protein